jgi:hypothetical protein
MKKQIRNYSLLIAMTIGFMLQSCTKQSDSSKNTALSTIGSSTITGRIIADLNLSNGNKEKEGVEGLKVTASVNLDDLITTGSVNGMGLIRTYEAITNSKGEYTLNIEANNKPVHVSLDFPKTFNANQTLENGTTRMAEYNKVTVTPTSILMNKGQVYTQNVEYNTTVQPEIGTVKVSGEVYFRNNLCKTPSAQLDSTLSIAPANTTIILTWIDDNSKNREAAVAVDINGRFTYSIETTRSNLSVTVKGRMFYADRQSKINSTSPCTTQTGWQYTLNAFSISINKNEELKLSKSLTIFQ